MPPIGGVTPYVGVWIETQHLIGEAIDIKVTPYVGVWIETLILITLDQPPIVTPYVGVWIETMMLVCHMSMALSHPTWVCGLKP